VASPLVSAYHETVSEAQAPEPRVCPKCGRKSNASGESCPRCGLTFALWQAEAGSPVVALDAQGEEMWAKVQGSWTDSALHEDFLRHCLQAGTLAAAGRLYRDRLDDNPKDAVAAHMQSQVLAKAALGLTINKSQPREPVTRNRWFWVVVLTAMALGIAGGLLWRYIR
jgi:hypothetical protein